MINREALIDFFKEYEEFQPQIIKRELEIPLDTNFIISIIGPRRAGKTYYLFQIKNLKPNSLYLNFEDSRLIGANFRDIREMIRLFEEIYGIKPQYLLLDEIHNVKNWEIIIREIHDLKLYKIVITGSSSKLLSKEISTKLRGRTLSYVLFPFSFREFLDAKKISIEKFLSKEKEVEIKRNLREYIEFGGFPEVILNDQIKINIIKQYYDLILFRDFIERHEIRNIGFSKFLLNFVLQNFSKEVSIKSIYDKTKSSNLKVSKDTVYDYLDKLNDTLVFFFLNRYSVKVHIRESWPKKIYVVDNGLTKVVKFSQDFGKLMENCVFLELKRKQNKNPLLEFYYLVSNDYEVDFVIKEGLEIKQLIQVTYASSKDEIEKREIKALLKASEELKCKNLLIITWDYEDELEIENKSIKCIPLWKWLLF
ncbi:MAG: ATP-binding protein [Candidatus Aenigmatarchaeota archaeon]